LPENNIQKRQTAYKIRIKDIINSKYVKEEGWTPNYITTIDNRQISRANVVGVVVSKPIENGANYHSIVLDDGSAKISARVFDDGRIFDNVEIGDMVLLIGRPREYGQEKYILPEIIKKIENKDWVDVRKLELKKQDLQAREVKTTETKEEKAEVVEEEITEEKVEEKETGNIEKVHNLVKSMDHGDGVDYQEIVEKTGSEKEIKMLLEEGEIYEIRPGRLKVL